MKNLSKKYTKNFYLNPYISVHLIETDTHWLVEYSNHGIKKLKKFDKTSKKYGYLPERAERKSNEKFNQQVADLKLIKSTIESTNTQLVPLPTKPQPILESIDEFEDRGGKIRIIKN